MNKYIFFRNLRLKRGELDYRYPEFDPIPTPIGRAYSPPKSRRSVQWSYGSPQPSLYFNKQASFSYFSYKVSFKVRLNGMILSHTTSYMETKFIMTISAVGSKLL